MIKTIIRTIFFYFFIMMSYRIMGKREVGQLGIIDLIVSILIAELVAISIENYNDSIFLTIIPIIILILLEIFLGYASIKSRKLNRFFGGKPTLIINKGELLFSNMSKEHYSLDDLLLELRQKSISSIEEVEYAFLEPNGKLSIFKYNFLKQNKALPLPVIVEGHIQDDTLKIIGKTKSWLEKSLEKNSIDYHNVFYCIYKNNHLYVIKKSICS